MFVWFLGGPARRPMDEDRSPRKKSLRLCDGRRGDGLPAARRPPEIQERFGVLPRCYGGQRCHGDVCEARLRHGFVREKVL